MRDFYLNAMNHIRHIHAFSYIYLLCKSQVINVEMANDFHIILESWVQDIAAICYGKAAVSLWNKCKLSRWLLAWLLGTALRPESMRPAGLLSKKEPEDFKSAKAFMSRLRCAVLQLEKTTRRGLSSEKVEKMWSDLLSEIVLTSMLFESSGCRQKKTTAVWKCSSIWSFAMFV